jgi:hypothetical protein
MPRDQESLIDISVVFTSECDQQLALREILTDVTWNPHPPSPSPAGDGEQNPYFLVPLSCGRGARGEGFTIFHVTPDIN